MRGVFITIEGIDGAGKSTQAQMLAAWLRERGREVVVTREPGGSKLGEHLRRALLDGEAQVSAVAELLLYGADRAQHVGEVIRPALSQGKAVVCERYADSTAAYQGYARGLDLEFVHRLNCFATGGLEPDLTLLLDLPPQLARERMAKTPDRLEREAPAFHQRVAEGYRELARAHPQRVRVIDAALAPEQVFRQVAQVVSHCLRQPGWPTKGGRP
jgi:dTMP kinase